MILLSLLYSWISCINTSIVIHLYLKNDNFDNSSKAVMMEAFFEIALLDGLSSDLMVWWSLVDQTTESYKEEDELDVYVGWSMRDQQYNNLEWIEGKGTN